MSTATTNHLTGHCLDDAQKTLAREATTSPAAISLSEPKVPTLQGAPLPADHVLVDAQILRVGGSNFPEGQGAPEAHRPRALGDTNHLTGQGDSDAHSPIAREATTSDSGHLGCDDQKSFAAVGTDPDQPANLLTTPSELPLADPTLALAADVLDDLERVKIANQNRLRALTRDAEDSDGEMRGFGLDETHPDVARLAALVNVLEQAEHDATLNLQRAMRKHPLGPWVKAQRGVGEKQAARLLAKIGDPYINAATGQPRTVSALWAYCGLHVIDGESARRRKGQQANWSTIAKTRAWLIVQSAMKQLAPTCKTDTGIGDHIDGCACSPYRIAIDKRRTHTATTHPDWTPGHSLNDAMRVASKQLLRDLWIEARRIHQEQA